MTDQRGTEVVDAPTGSDDESQTLVEPNDETTRDTCGDTKSVTDDDDAPDATFRRRRPVWSQTLAFVVLPAVALLIVVAAGYLKWADSSARDDSSAGSVAVHAATDSTIALLSYQPDTVEGALGAATDRLTGTFKDSYTSLTRDVVIPGAKQKHIAAVASVPAAAAVSATEKHAVVLVFVNQTVTVGNDPPTNTASAVRITLDKTDDRWLISQFDPI